MSGVRVHDPELLKLGLTLPGFVRRGQVIASLPSLGLLYLAAMTPDGGHELVYLEAEGAGKEPAEAYACDLVAISTFSAQVFEAYEVADRLRAAGVKVAMGGLHVSVESEEATRHADYVVIGEGENVWPDVVRHAQAGGGARKFFAASHPPVDVKALPVPRYDLLAGRDFNRITVQTTRGCPWRCEFCASNVMLELPYRKRRVEDVVRDIAAIQQCRPGAFIEFADDNTFVDKEWGKRLCRALIPLRVRWFTETDISVADDPELLALMAEAGCRQVLIGLESPNEADVRGVELKRNFKARRVAGYAEAIRRIQCAGITLNGCFVLGLDHHTTSVFPAIRDFADDVSLYDVQVTVQTAFPGTPLYKRLMQQGRIIMPRRWDLCTLFDVNFHPARMTANELRAGLYWLTSELYEEGALRRRRAAALSMMRRSRRGAGALAAVVEDLG
ncbi:B12-binding domain-containing radical SAM protein [Candidatus Sumerlaeota bacterium]|nr:B12-binding domain-containing radical SAM protein [Candidatus Sumerlaeota bacterium]